MGRGGRSGWCWNTLDEFLVVPSVRATARSNREGQKKPVRHAGMCWDFCSLEFLVGAAYSYALSHFC